jgi:ceramide glucosyltransferase
MIDLLSLLLIPVFFSAAFWLATTVCVYMFMRSAAPKTDDPGKLNDFKPPVSLLKPVCGLEKNLHRNLSTACRQDYPDYEVIFAVQSDRDPALTVIEQIKTDFRHVRIKVVVDSSEVGINGKVNNLHNAVQHAAGSVLVVSDSDMHLAPDYLDQIVNPLKEKRVGIACTLYQAWRPDNILEAMELLTYNSDFLPSMLFAYKTRTSIVCPGATMAIRTEVLKEVGGLQPLGDYFVEDFELGRRVVNNGYQIIMLPYTVNMQVDLSSFSQWWRHQVYWDQNTKAVNPVGFIFTLLARGIPFALLYALLGGAFGWLILVGSIAWRMTTGSINAVLLKDAGSITKIWLLPFRDLAGLFVWMASLLKRRTYWRGKLYTLSRGKMVPVK